MINLNFRKAIILKSRKCAAKFLIRPKTNTHLIYVNYIYLRLESSKFISLSGYETTKNIFIFSLILHFK